MKETIEKKIEELKKLKIENQRNIIAIDGALIVCVEILKEFEKSKDEVIEDGKPVS